MSAAPITNLHDFVPKNPFLQDLIDTAADETTEELTHERVRDEEKIGQRQEYVKMLSELACLRGRGIVNMILGELEIVHTNREFLDAMKRIEPLIRRVRQRLSEVQILVHNRDALAPLEFTRATTNKPVPAYKRLSAERNSTESQAAVLFLSRVLPRLGRKMNEIEGWAHQVGEPVFRDDFDFSGEKYGINGHSKKIGRTDVDVALWSGVQFERWSKGHLLLQVCAGYKPGDTISMSLIREKLYPNASPSEEIEKRLNSTLHNILVKFPEWSKPFSRSRGGLSIVLSGDKDETAFAIEASGFIPNADFLDQPITLNGWAHAAPIVPEALTLDMIADIWLSDEAQELLRTLMQNEGIQRRVSEICTATVAVKIDTLVAEINRCIAPRTNKRVTKAGKMICFATLQE